MKKSSPSTCTSSRALYFNCFIPLSLSPVGSLHDTENPLLLACYDYGLTHPSLHEAINSPRNLFLLPTLKMEAESSPKHWQQITIQHSHIPEVYNLQQQCHGNLKPQNLYTYRVYHIKHTLTL